MDYIKVKYGKRWLLVRPNVGGDGFRSVAAFDAESEIDAVLKSVTQPALRAVK